MPSGGWKILPILNRSHLLGEPETTIDQVPPSFQSKSCKDSSSDEEVEAPAIASDSDEEVVFTKPNVAGSSAAPKNEDVQMAKVVAISEKKGYLGDFWKKNNCNICFL